MVTEVVIILSLSLVNGVFSMAELAVVSSSRARLASISAQGDRRADKVLALLENPSAFLATVQIGITLIGIGAGVFGGAAMAADLSAWLNERHFLSLRVAEPLAFVVVIGSITYLSLVLGELVPKQIALGFPEKIAMLVAGPLGFVSKLARPLVCLLERSSKIVSKLFPFHVGSKDAVNEDDIRHMISEGAARGEIQLAEKEIAYRVLRLNDRPIRAFMTSRREVVWLDLDKPFEELWKLALSSSHSFFPVARGELDRVLGVISIKDMCVVTGSGGKATLDQFIKTPLKVPSTSDALRILNQFKAERRQMALVFNEHGGLDGIVTTHDLLEAIVGDLADFEGEENLAVHRRDGSWLVNAGIDIHELLLIVDKEMPKDEIDGAYHSLGGLISSTLKTIPTEGATIDWNGLLLEVVDMDGRRIDKVIVTPAEVPVKNAE